ncbi:MAG TPA: hypothetical protein PLN52_01535, partial [Opitutaceae bacterium]|nr:hypothetical protein [Opitutaceae bacterium]
MLSYIPLRVLTGALEEDHRGAVLGLSLMLSATIIFVVAMVGDRKSGIEVWSRRAWTSELLESQHICFHVPLRLAGVVMLGAGIVVALVL